MTPLPEEERRLLDWIGRATRELSHESRIRVEQEIRDHFESARDDELVSGNSEDVAYLLALNSLGDPEAANKAYRKVHLTQAEDEVLRSLKNSPTFGRGYTVFMFCLGLYCFAGGILEIFYTHNGAAILSGIVYILIALTPSIQRKRSLMWPNVYFGTLMICCVGILYLIDNLFFQISAMFLTVVFVERVWPKLKLRRELRRKLPVEKWPDGLFM
jgi:hypothetical protein